MKRTHVCLIYIFLMSNLIGCKFSVKDNEMVIHNGSSTTYCSTSDLAVMIIIVGGIVAWILAVAYRYLIRERKGNWKKTVANIIDGNKDYVDGLGTIRGKYNAIVYPNYRIEYFVDGKRYEKMMNGQDLIGCTDTIFIEYLERHPDTFRKFEE